MTPTDVLKLADAIASGEGEYDIDTLPETLRALAAVYEASKKCLDEGYIMVNYNAMCNAHARVEALRP